MEAAQQTRRTKVLQIDGLGEVRIQAYSSTDRTRIEQAHILHDDPTRSIVKFGKFRELCCALALVDDDGKRLFDPDRQADVDTLKTFDGLQLEQIAKAALIMSGMQKEAKDELGKD